MATFSPAWIAIVLVVPFATGCLGSPSSPAAHVTPSPTPAPTSDITPASVDPSKPVEVSPYKGTVSGAGTPAFSLDLPTTDASADIKKTNGSLRFELKFAPSGAANQLHVEVDDLGTSDAAGQPVVLGAKDGGPLVVIDVPAAKLAGAKELGYRVFFASGSAGQGTEFQAIASLFNGTIPPTYTAFK